MKNQTDLIVSIVALFLAVVVVTVCFFTAPQPTQPATPAAIVTTPVTLPVGAVKYANSLPGSGNGGAGGGGGRMGAAGGGRAAGPGGSVGGTVSNNAPVAAGVARG